MTEGTGENDGVFKGTVVREPFGSASTRDLAEGDRRRTSEDAAEAPGRAGRVRVVLGVRDLLFHQEVLDFLIRDPRIEVAAAADEPARVVAFVQEDDPNALVVCPATARELRHPVLMGGSRSLFVVAEEMTVPILREAIEAGAQAIFAWPEEREDLARALSRARSARPAGGASRGMVVGVHGARGGIGTTFLSTHLAAAFADRGLKTVLMDVDGGPSDLPPALGIAGGEELRSAADLMPVVDELAPTHVADVLHRHSRGFDVLFGPTEETDAGPVPPGLYRAAAALLALSHEVVVLQVGRSSERVARAGLDLADQVVLVSGLDLFSLYGARRALRSLGLDHPPGRCRLVVNRSGRSSLSRRDVRRLLDIEPAMAVRFDATVPRVQDEGELLPARARRAWRDVRLLAALLLSPVVAKG